MKKTIRDMRPVFVVGIGLHKYQHMSDTTFVTLGLTAVRQALADAGIQYSDIESAFDKIIAPKRKVIEH